MLTNKLVIKKYVLNKLKWNNITGTTPILADIVTANISFIFEIESIIFLFVLYSYFVFLGFIFLSILKIVLLNKMIPIVPKYDNCIPTFVIRKGL